jgi:hypothetical protein
MTRVAQTTILATGSALALMTGALGDHAHAEGKLDASYTISFARIRVGDISASGVFGESEYAISARGRAGGIMKVLVDGEASFATHGTIKDGYPVPTTFTSKIVSDAETSGVTMVLDEGSVKELAATVPPPKSDRVPVTQTNRQGIVDPLTAMLFSATAAGKGLHRDVCRHTLPIFDGQQRYDLKLAFKRMDKVTAEIRRASRGLFPKLRTNRRPSPVSAYQISFRRPRNRDGARTGRRHAAAGAVQNVG